MSLAPHFLSPSFSCGIDMTVRPIVPLNCRTGRCFSSQTRTPFLSLSLRYEAELLQRVVQSGGGNTTILRHNLESQLLFALQQSPHCFCVLLASSETPFLHRIRRLCPSLSCHTPQWLYDQLEGVSNALQTIYCEPRAALGLREMRCVVRCGELSEGVERVVEQTGALVLGESGAFMTHWVSDRWFEAEPQRPILHYRWFVDCLTKGCVVAKEEYVCVP